MEESLEHRLILGVFAHYGFRKASMADLASAAQISRQTLYNRFRTKQAVLDWAVGGFVASLYAQARAELVSDGPLNGNLAGAFVRWLGDLVPLLHDSPHGMEMLELGMESLKRINDPDRQFELAIAEFLQDRLRLDATASDDMTFVLVMAAKGLLLKSTTTDAFALGMERVVRAVVK